MRRESAARSRDGGRSDIGASRAGCGTVAVHREIAAMADGDAFEMELHDPGLGRSLRHRYAVDVLPVVA